MPNHVANCIDFSNTDKAVFERVCAFANTTKELGDKGCLFDFNRFYPMPESLNIECGSNTEIGKNLAHIVDGVDFASDKRYDSEEALCIRMKQEGIVPQDQPYFTGADAERFATETPAGASLLELGRAAMQNLKQHGAETWYNWRVAHWGTKWNAWDVSIDAERQQIHFDTAWSFPEPIAWALAEKFPESEFAWTYADEDAGCNTGFFDYIDGFASLTRFDNQSDEAYEVYASVWDAESCLGKEENGNWIRYACDECPNAASCGQGD